ncbi:MFS transporter [Asanoa sp. WMMD1127]|uniref:MFS transporter n=1 Tax=Asanoa sp. WMMD1127 TaxID=3016107 RepID=UPI0024171A10|nr:MFS transporter [Asanoa sp. WMMD1127]MDG4821168.1 MFS transporter [Asanoa sp. WMMD1127]
MAYRTWGRVLLAALVVGLLAGAGQLGFAYGLGVVRFARDFSQLSGQWTAHLAWVAWFAMLAAVAGGVAGSFFGARAGLTATVGTRVAVSVAGGVGALAVAPLAMLPARGAVAASGDAVTIAGLSAALGALVGVFAAVAVLSQRVAGLNLGAITVVVWLVALLSVAPSLGPDDPLPEVRLGVLDAAWLGDGLAQRLAVILMPALALAVGAGIGALARWRGLPLIPVAVSGVVGPAMLALAYLIAGPGDGGDRYQAAPYWGALIAVAAGGLGSVLAAVARQLTGGESGASVPRHGDHTAEVFPGAATDDTVVATGAKAEADEPSRGSWGGEKPSAGGRDDDSFSSRSFGGESADRDGPGGSASGFGDRDALGGSAAGGFGGRGDRDPLGGSASGGAFGGRDDRDPLGGSTSSFEGGFGSGAALGRERAGDDRPGAARDDDRSASGGDFGSSRARDLGDVERSSTPRVGDGLSPSSSGASLFNPPTPVAPPRQPEVLSPPPGPEPTPIRPFDRQPSAGPGDWRTDRTSTFSTPSVPVVPAQPTGASERRDDGEARQRPTAIRPRPLDREPRDTPEAPAKDDWRTRGSQSGGPSARPADEMPDWRLAPPAWTPPAPVQPGEPTNEPTSEPTGDAGADYEAVPAKAPEQKRRGLFRRKNKPEPAAPKPAADGDDDWVQVSESAASNADAGPSATSEQAPTGPRGFGFGGLVTSRFGQEKEDPENGVDAFGERIGDSAADRRSGTLRGGDQGAAAPRSGGSYSAGDDGAATGVRSWADRAGARAAAPAEPESDPKERSGRRSDRHLRSVDLGDSDTGSWDIDDPAPAADKDDDKTSDDADAKPGRTGLFRRNRAAAEPAEAQPEASADETSPEPPRGRRGKAEKQRDDDYVDWVAGLSAPEPVNERRRDDTPRRSLRSTTRQTED